MSPAFSHRPITWPQPLREWVLWALIFALPIYGVSGALAHWIGAQHFHRAVQGQGHSHAHTRLARHHHATAETQPVAVGARGQAQLDAGDLSLTQALAVPVVALASLPVLVLNPDLSHAWPWGLAALPVGRCLSPLERPPRA